MAKVTELPTELIVLIMSSLEREELKAWRLTDRAFGAVATAKLFEEIHISPNSNSFDRAHQVAARDHLSKHVRSLVYHFGKLAEIYGGFESFNREYFATRRDTTTRDPDEIGIEVLWNYTCWLEEINAQRTFNLRYENEELCNLCNRLPRLESVATILDEANPFGDQEDYIGKRTGMAAMEDDGWGRFPLLFAAAVHKPLQKVSARSIQWHNLGFMEEGTESEIKAIRDCLNKLKFLELGIYRSPHDFEYEFEDGSERIEYLHHVDLLDAILSQAYQLETLKLDFDELPYESWAETCLPVSKAIFKHLWPRLRELKLGAICAHEDELCTFLNSHRKSLKRLYIGDIELVKEGDGTPSILRMFTTLHRSLDLWTCKITGNFTNRIDQAWYVNVEHHQPGCLRDQLERYLCGMRSAAFPGVEATDGEMDYYCTSGEHLEKWLHKIDGGYETVQDDSWQWYPELLAQ